MESHEILDWRRQQRPRAARRGGRLRAARAWGLAQLGIGDWIAYYSPRTRLEGGDPVQAFSAIGRVTGEVFQVSLEGFCPFRRTVEFMPDAVNASIKPLIAELSFIKDPQRWGYPLMRGQLEVSAADMLVIAAAMGVSLGAVPA